MHTITQPCGRGIRRALALGTIALLTSSVASAKADIEGTWILSKPQTLLQPANGEPVPLTDEGKRIYQENKASAQQGKFAFDEAMDRCASPGIPRLMLSNKRFQVFDLPGKILFVFEWNRLFRQIDMRDDATIENSKPLPKTGGFPFAGGFPGGAPGGGPPGGAPGGFAPPAGGGFPGGAGGPPGGFPGGGAGGPSALGDRWNEEEATGSQMGHARGHWEGNVLVADNKHFADFKLLDGLIQTSDELTLTERFRLKDKNTLEYKVTITDPVTFTKPWDAVLTFKRQPDEALSEDVCLDRKRNGEVVWPKP